MTPLRVLLAVLAFAFVTGITWFVFARPASQAHLSALPQFATTTLPLATSGSATTTTAAAPSDAAPSATTLPTVSTALSYPIAGTGVTVYFGANGIIAAPTSGAAFYGQDATYDLNPPAYTDNGDGTVTDKVTGLMWQQNMGSPMTLAQAEAEAKTSTLGGYHDWRVANVKELFSLILYTGVVRGNTPVTPFINTSYFVQPAGGTGTAVGDRSIDAQTLSSTPSVAKTMANDTSIFGVNFVDGHVKAYPVVNPATGAASLKYFRLVRGNPSYGVNTFVDNKDGTVTDRATGLMWAQDDSGKGMDWEHALAYCEGLALAGQNDWRLPSVKELESIVDYTRSPETTHTAAIDPLFKTTQITDPDGTKDYPYFWSATTFLGSAQAGDMAAYVAFGRSIGKLANGTLVDAHGAGAVRSDPKSGTASAYPKYLGPQNDLQRVFNYARCVRTL